MFILLGASGAHPKATQAHDLRLPASLKSDGREEAGWKTHTGTGKTCKHHIQRVHLDLN